MDMGKIINVNSVSQIVKKNYIIRFDKIIYNWQHIINWFKNYIVFSVYQFSNRRDGDLLQESCFRWRKFSCTNLDTKK